MKRFGLYATPALSAVLFLIATIIVFTDDPSGTAAQAKLSLGFYLTFFGGLDGLSTAGWIAVARLAATGNLPRARGIANALLVWLIVDAILSVAGWPTYEGNDLILAGLLGLGLLQVLYIATTLSPSLATETPS